MSERQTKAGNQEYKKNQNLKIWIKKFKFKMIMLIFGTSSSGPTPTQEADGLKYAYFCDFGAKV